MTTSLSGALVALLALAWLGALPDAGQRLAAELASDVGLDLPGADEGSDDAVSPAPECPDDSEEPITDEPVAEQPVAEEPVTEEPGCDEAEGPVADTPGTDPDVVEDPADTVTYKNHGEYVSSVAHDQSVHGCEHGRAVSNAARSKHGKAPNEKPCPSHGADDGDSADEPTTEEPVAEEPTTDEPATDEPATDDSLQTLGETDSGQSSHGKPPSHGKSKKQR